MVLKKLQFIEAFSVFFKESVSLCPFEMPGTVILWELQRNWGKFVPEATRRCAPHPHLPPRLFRTYVIVIHDFSQGDRYIRKKNPFHTLPSTKILEVFLGFHPCRYHQTNPPKRNINLSQKTKIIGCLLWDFLFFLNPCTPNQLNSTNSPTPGFARKISQLTIQASLEASKRHAASGDPIYRARGFLFFFGGFRSRNFCRLFEVFFFFGWGKSAESESPAVKLQ